MSQGKSALPKASACRRCQVERRGNRTSPLQRERRSDVLFGGEAELLDPVADGSATSVALGFERGLDFRGSELAARNHKQAKRHAARRLRRPCHRAQPGNLPHQRRLQAFRAAVETAMKDDAESPANKPLPERPCAQTRNQAAHRIGTRGAAMNPRRGTDDGTNNGTKESAHKKELNEAIVPRLRSVLGARLGALPDYEPCMLTNLKPMAAASNRQPPQRAIRICRRSRPLRRAR